MQNQEIMINQWFNEDKDHLSKNISLIEDLTKFYEADLIFEEKNGILSFSNIFKWSEIIKNNNSNSNKSNQENRKINKKDKKDNYSNNNNSIYNNEESKESKKINYSNSDKSLLNQNIILKNKVLRLKEDSIYLRSLSVECEINILMSGESNFYIFSRCGNKLSEATAVCCISKELESARKFISFGVLEKEENEKFCLKNIKKQEIPRQDNHIKTLDISEFKFIFIDNGDNRCFVFLSEQELMNSNLFLVGDFFVPIETKCNLMFAVSGDLVSIKKLIIKQTYRNSYINYKNNNTNDSIQSCSCCNII